MFCIKVADACLDPGSDALLKSMVNRLIWVPLKYSLSSLLHIRSFLKVHALNVLLDPGGFEFLHTYHS